MISFPSNQLVQAWIFVAVSKDNPTDLRELPHSLSIWQCLESRFNIASLARYMDLQCMLTNLSILKSQSMEDFLRSAQSLTNSLATIHALVSSMDIKSMLETRACMVAKELVRDWALRKKSSID